MWRPQLVADPEQVTADWLTSVLRFAGDLDSGRVVGFEAESVGTGQMGANVRFHLDVAAAPPSTPRSIVGKFASKDPVSRATGVTQGSYMKEVRFYNEVASTVDIRTPRCLFAEFEPPTSDFVLVMEDLAPARQGDQIRGCSADEAALALSELAKLHAPRWGDPALARLDWLPRRSPETAQIVQVMYRTVWKGFVDRYGARLAPEALAVAERFGGSLAHWMNTASGATTVTHGDYRLDNLLFGTEDGGYPLAVVDWQTVGQGFALADASYFLGAGLETETRRAQERALLREYHRELVARGARDYSWERCWDDYRRFSFAGVLMAVVASMIVQQSQRGDAMFLAMASRHCAHALDLEATEFLSDAPTSASAGA